MNENLNRSAALRFWIPTASFAIIVVVMQLAAPILVPILLSLVFSSILAPIVFWLEGKGLGTAAALVTVILGFIIIGGGLALIVSASLTDLSNLLPLIESQLNTFETALEDQLAQLRVEFAGFNLAGIVELLRPTIRAIRTITQGLGQILGSLFLVIILVIFTLFELSNFSGKLQSAVAASDRLGGLIQKVATGVKDFVVVKTWIGLFIGLGVGLWLTLLDIRFAALLALLAFLLSYIPSIGPLLAAIPAVILGFLQAGLGGALLVAAGYLAVSGVANLVLTPRFAGRELDLSMVVIFISLAFWGWVLGPVAGLFLALPLTVAIKILLEENEDTHWLGVLLGAGASAEATSPDPPGESTTESD